MKKTLTQTIEPMWYATRVSGSKHPCPIFESLMMNYGNGSGPDVWESAEEWPHFERHFIAALEVQVPVLSTSFLAYWCAASAEGSL